MIDYAELRCRSAFSFLRGASTPEKLAEQAAALGLPAVALCDRDGVYGAPRFYERARELGVRPLVGAELTMDDGAILPVLVESRAGYENLCRMLTRAHLRAPKGQGRLGWAELPEFAAGLVALVRGREAVQRGVEIFGRGQVYAEVWRHRVRGEETQVREQIELAARHQVPLLAVNDVCHAAESDRPVLDVLTCMRHHTHLDAAGRLLEQNGERHLKSAAQMRALFPDLPGAVDNTLRLAERLEFTLQNLGYEFPTFDVPPSTTWIPFSASRPSPGRAAVMAPCRTRCGGNWRRNWR